MARTGSQYLRRTTGRSSVCQRTHAREYTETSAATASAIHHQLISGRSSLSSHRWEPRRAHTRLASEATLIATSRTRDRTLRDFFSLKFHDSLDALLRRGRLAFERLLKVLRRQRRICRHRLAPQLPGLIVLPRGPQRVAQINHGAAKLRLVL